ncbi:MAG: YdcF family protein [Clostridiales bacterium]|nr:YdcF family protein [Clostridiales bacterium]
MRLKNTIILLLSLCIIFYSVLLYRVVTFNSKPLPKISDAIIVLGHSIDEKNNPSGFLAKRLQTALYLYENGYANKIIVSGGQGPKDNIPVAEPMANYLISNGVPKEDIYLEKGAGDTYENFKYSKTIAQSGGIKSVIIVTDDFHMFRSALICNEFFDQYSTYMSQSKFSFNKLFAYLKEPFSLIKFYAVLRAGSPAIIATGPVLGGKGG